MKWLVLLVLGLICWGTMFAQDTHVFYFDLDYTKKFRYKVEIVSEDKPVLDDNEALFISPFSTVTVSLVTPGGAHIPYRCESQKVLYEPSLAPVSILYRDSTDDSRLHFHVPDLIYSPNYTVRIYCQFCDITIPEGYIASKEVDMSSYCGRYSEVRREMLLSMHIFVDK